MKRLTAILLTLCMAISVFSFPASAETGTGSTNAAITGGDFNISADNSFGRLIAGEFAALEETQALNNGYNIFTVEVSGKEASVELETQSDCTLIVGIYDEGKTKLLASGNLDVTKGATDAVVTLSGDIPDYFYIKAFLIDSMTFAPLCTEFTSSLYTESMQDLINKTVDDFDEASVVNLDDDKKTNFLVVGEDTVLTSKEENKNVLVSMDVENKTYVFENAGKEITSLANGDKFVYCGDTDIIAIKVASVKTEDGKTTVIEQDAEPEEIFDCIKIEGTADMDDVEVDTSKLGEGVEFAGFVEEDLQKPEAQVVDREVPMIEAKNQAKLHFVIGEYKDETGDDESKGEDKKDESEGISGSVKVTGAIDISGEFSLKLYIDIFTESYVEIKFESTTSYGITVETKGTIKVPLGGLKFKVPISKKKNLVEIDFTPAFTAEATAKFKYDGEVKDTAGLIISSKDGVKAYSTDSDATDPMINVELKYFLGITFEPTIDLLDGLFKCEFKAKIGFNLKSETRAKEKEGSKIKHQCLECNEGDLTFAFEMSFKVKIPILSEIEDKYTTSFKICDFYYSVDHDEFGNGKCPYDEYKTTFLVRDKDKKAVSDATVKIYKNDSEGASDKPLEEKNTNEKGKFTVYLEKGSYNASASKGTSLKTETFEVPDDSDVTIEFDKNTFKTTFKVNDSNDKAANGATVKIYVKDPSDGAYMLVDSLKTNGSGEVSVELEKGDYKAEASKDKASAEKTFKVTSESTVQIKLEKNSFETTLKVTDSDGNAAKGATVKIYKKGSGDDAYTLIDTYTTDTKGEVSVELEKGDYKVEASKDKDSAKKTFKVTADSTVQIKLEETAFETTFKVTDSDGNAAKGATVKIFKKDSADDTITFVDTVMTNGSGEASVDLVEGDYKADASKGDTTDEAFFTVSKESSVTLKLHKPGKKIKSICIGTFHCAAITEDGCLYTWGDNFWGELGDGTQNDSCTPVKVMENVECVSVGTECNAAITKDGSLYTWGYNAYGILGDETKSYRSYPAKIMDNVKLVSLGEHHGAAITTDGSLYMWGKNYERQIFNNHTDVVSTPIKVMDNVKYVSLGYDNTAVITNDGSLYTCGNNCFGYPDWDSKKDKSSPTKLLDNAKYVSMGHSHGAAITNDGSLYIWGINDRGQLGDGTKENKTYPFKLMDNVKSIDLGYEHSAAITNDGSLYIWGANERGEVGDGTGCSLLPIPWGILPIESLVTNDKYYPVKIMDDVKLVNLGKANSAVIKNDGSLYMWGANPFGIFGFEGDGQYWTPLKREIFEDENNSKTKSVASAKAAAKAAVSESQTAEFTGLKPGETYNFYVMKSRTADKPFAASNLLYIDQGTADKDGSISFNYIPREACDSFTAFVVGASGDEVGDDTVSGDANGDGSVNNIDASIVLQYDAGVITLESAAFKAADVNGDGSVNNIDASRILQLDAGVISKF